LTFTSGGSILASNTVNTLTTAGALSVTGDQTVTGTFTCTGAVGSRASIRSATAGTQYTITANAVSISYTDFYGINAAGTSAPWSGTSFGDLSLNNNITFTSPKTVYWSLAAGGA